MKENKKSFVLYQDFYSTLMRLNLEERGLWITAVFEYHGTGEVSVPLEGKVDVAFDVVRNTLDRDAVRYEERCLRNRENGKKGGRPRKNPVFNEEDEEDETDEMDETEESEEARLRREKVDAEAIEAIRTIKAIENSDASKEVKKQRIEQIYQYYQDRVERIMQGEL